MLLKLNSWSSRYGGADNDSAAVTTILLVFALLACQSAEPGPARQVLYVPADASQIQWVREFDGSVRYAVNAEFPAEGFLQQVRQKLTRDGFTPAANDLFNPTMENSHRRGWVDYLDGTDTVFVWAGDWKNERGDHVRYDLRYRVGPKEKTPKRNLTVVATYLDVSTVMRMEAARNKPPRD